MNLTESILNYRRYWKRKNYSRHAMRNYLNILQHFLVWISVPVEAARPADVKGYIDFLLGRQLSAQTINAHQIVSRRFYSYLKDERTYRWKILQLQAWLRVCQNLYPGMFGMEI